MKKRKFNKKTLFIILGVLLLGILTVLGTYAYFAWSSTGDDKDATIAVSSVNGLGQCDKITDNQKSLWPVSSRDKGRIVNVNAKQTLSEYAYITWTLTIDSINTQDTETDGLKHQSFKYELVNSNTGVSYGSGNFEGLDVGDTITFSNNNEVLDYDTDYTFTLYLWIDGTIGRNPMDMTDQTYQFSLVCDITGVPENNNTYTSISDFNYVLGTDTDTVSYFNNAYAQMMGLASADLLAEDEVILLSYIGDDTVITIPNKYTVNGVDYTPVLCLNANIGGQQYGTFANNTNITDVYIGGNVKSLLNNFNNMFSGCTSLINVPVIPSSVTSMEGTFSNCTSLVTAPVIPSSVTNMTDTFLRCTSLVTAPVIPSSVTNMTDTFFGCSNLTGTVRIESSNVNSVMDTFINTAKNITVEVPENSATYNSFNDNVPGNVTLTTFGS